MLAEAAKVAANTTAVLAALHQAAAETGSDFDYLLSTAKRESSLKPQAQSSTSSAAGLFQFVDQTWLGLVKTYGAKYGLAGMAAAISKGADGRFHADNQADRQAILALRKDPQVSALMAGEFTNQTKATLENALGRGVCNGELYAAHFLGPEAACKLIQMSAAEPDANAAAAFPRAAGANRSVFYNADGSAKTVRQVYDWTLRRAGGAAHTNAVAQADLAMPSRGSDASPAAPMLDGMTDWQPSHDFFGDGGSGGSFPTAPFLLTPGLMDVLSSLSTVADGRKPS